MSGRILVSDPLARRVQTMHVEGGKVVLNTAFDAQDMVDEAAMARNAWAGNYKGSPHLGATRVAILPMTILMELRKQGIMQDKKAFAKWLNEHPAFKAVDGHPLG